VGSGAYFDTNWYPRQMIPRLQKKIAAAYPAGSIAAPGREGVYAATAWPLKDASGNFLIAAFDLYRNYDGNGAIVGDLAVQATTTDPKNTSVYAFAHSDGSTAVDVVAINKKTSTQSVTVQIAGAPALTAATIYQIAGKTAAVAKGGAAINFSEAKALGLLKRKEWNGLQETFTREIFPRLAGAVSAPRAARMQACIEATTRLRTLADFGAVHFVGARANGRPLGASDWSKVNMISNSWTLASAAALSGDGTGFTVVWDRP